MKSRALIVVALIALVIGGIMGYRWYRVRELTSVLEPGQSLPPEVERLAGELDSLKKEDRAAACGKLARVSPGHPSVIVLLIRGLKDGEASVRAAAAGALQSHVFHPDAVRRALPALLDAIDDENLETRSRAAYAVWRCGVYAGSAVPRLRRAFRGSTDVQVRGNVIRAIGETGEPAREALPELLEAIADESPFVVSSACYALAPLGAAGRDSDRVRAALAEALLHENHGVRESAAWAFWKMSGELSPASSAEIDAGLGSKERADRALAVSRIGRLSLASAEAVPGLVRLFDDDDPAIRFCAVLVLARRLESSGPESRLDPLLGALRHEHAGVRRAVARGLQSLGGREPLRTAPALAEALRDSDPEVRQFAAEALCSIGPPAWPAVSALSGAVRWDVQRRWAYLAALERIGPAAVPALLDLFSCEAEEVHHQAVQVLLRLLVTARAEKGQVEEQARIGPSLRQALQDPDFAWEALRGGHLERWGGEARCAVPALVTILRDPKRYNWVQQEVIEGLAKMGPAAQEAVPALCEALAGQYNDQRVVAANALGRIGPAAASGLPMLRLALASEHSGLREAAVRSIALIDPGGEEGLAALRAGLQDSTPRTRIESARRLWGVRPGDIDVLTVLRDVCRAPDGAHYVRDVMQALVEMNPVPVEALPLALEGLADRNEGVRAVAVDAVERLTADPRRAAELLGPGLSDPHAWVRCAAVRAVGRLHSRGHSGSVASVAKALEDADMQVRGAAAEALGLIGPPARSAIPGLTRVLLSSESGAPRGRAAASMSRIGPDSEEAVKALLATMLDSNGGAQSEASGALKSLGPEAKGSVPVLVKALGHPWPWTREVASTALGSIGPPAVEAAPALGVLLDSEDGNVREAAAEALGRIGGRGLEVLRARLARPAVVNPREAGADIDVAARVAAMVALVRADPSDSGAVSTLLAFAADGRWPAFRRVTAIDALGEMAPGRVSEITPVLVAGLGGGEELRERCAAALARFGPEARGCVPALVEHLHTARGKVRENSMNRSGADDTIVSVAFVLGEIGPGAGGAIPALEEIVRESDSWPKGSKAAAEALTRIRQGN